MLFRDTFAAPRNPILPPLELNKAWDGLAGGFPGGAGPMRSGVGGPLPAGTNRGRQSGTSRNLGPERLSVQG